jgi:hypothetical protein
MVSRTVKIAVVAPMPIDRVSAPAKTRVRSPFESPTEPVTPKPIDDKPVCAVLG